MCIFERARSFVCFVYTITNFLLMKPYHFSFSFSSLIKLHVFLTLWMSEELASHFDSKTRLIIRQFRSFVCMNLPFSFRCSPYHQILFSLSLSVQALSLTRRSIANTLSLACAITSTDVQYLSTFLPHILFLFLSLLLHSLSLHLSLRLSFPPSVLLIFFFSLFFSLLSLLLCIFLSLLFSLLFGLILSLLLFFFSFLFLSFSFTQAQG